MMQPLSASALLALWEENCTQPPLRQGLALLTAACPEERQETLLALPMGVFNAHLLTLHAWTFGPSLTAVTTCAGCGGVVEATLSAADLCASKSEPPPWLEVASEAGVVRFRLPTPADLLAAGEAATFDGAAQLLMARCLETPSQLLPPTIAAAVTAAMEEADPLAVIELSSACPHCGSPWSAFLDVASYLWREVQTWAQRTLYEIHLLARAYGWHEADILALTPMRRQTYLQMIYG
jgi:hypothetical protein